MKKIFIAIVSFFFFTFSKDVITVEQFKNGEIHPNDLICLNAKKAKRHLLLDAERARLSAK